MSDPIDRLIEEHTEMRRLLSMVQRTGDSPPRTFITSGWLHTAAYTQSDMESLYRLTDREMPEL